MGVRSAARISFVDIGSVTRVSQGASDHAGARSSGSSARCGCHPSNLGAHSRQRAASGLTLPSFPAAFGAPWSSPRRLRHRDVRTSALSRSVDDRALGGAPLRRGRGVAHLPARHRAALDGVVRCACVRPALASGARAAPSNAPHRGPRSGAAPSWPSRDPRRFVARASRLDRARVAFDASSRAGLTIPASRRRPSRPSSWPSSPPSSRPSSWPSSRWSPSPPTRPPRRRVIARGRRRHHRRASAGTAPPPRHRVGLGDERGLRRGRERESTQIEELARLVVPTARVPGR